MFNPNHKTNPNLASVKKLVLIEIIGILYYN